MIRESRQGVDVTAVDIMTRAAGLLTTPLPHPWACCEYDLGPYCPSCAVASATTDLSDGMAYDALDWPLRRASSAIDTVIGRNFGLLSEQEAIAVVEMAIANQAAE